MTHCGEVKSMSATQNGSSSGRLSHLIDPVPFLGMMVSKFMSGMLPKWV